LENLCEAELKGDVSGKRVLREVASGRLFGIPGLLREAANDFAALKQPMSKPTVLVVGEFYVRCVPFANDFVIQKLEERGCIAKLAPVNEWLEYVDHVNRFKRRITGLAGHVKGSLQAHIRRRTYGIMANVLGWPEQAPIEKCLEAARPYLRDALEGEAVVTLGSSIVEWREGHIDAAVSVGPLECMPNKVAEAQFFHVAEREGLPNLTIPLMGDPMNLSPLDNFTFEVKKRYEEKNGLAVT
jgi:predicted nucleotide-binding protein (sugar kinase/HSP70/actin superfamily)